MDRASTIRLRNTCITAARARTRQRGYSHGSDTGEIDSEILRTDGCCAAPRLPPTHQWRKPSGSLGSAAATGRAWARLPPRRAPASRSGGWALEAPAGGHARERGEPSIRERSACRERWRGCPPERCPRIRPMKAGRSPVRPRRMTAPAVAHVAMSVYGGAEFHTGRKSDHAERTPMGLRPYRHRASFSLDLSTATAYLRSRA